jgi:hypothetical protein
MIDAFNVLLTLPDGTKSAAELRPEGPAAGLTMKQYYLLPSCAGDAYVAAITQEELLPPTLVRRSGAWAVRPWTTASRPVRSFRVYSDSGSGACTSTSGALVTSQFDYYSLADLQLVTPLSVH